MSRDPWRVVEPIEAPAPVARRPTEKLNLGDDLDSDLVTSGTYSFSSRHGTIQITNTRVVSGDAALAVLIDCLKYLRVAGVVFNPSTTTLSTSDKALHVGFERMSYDEGMYKILCALREARYNTKIALKLQELGVMPIFK
jgi:hypothetical protein